MSLKKATTAKKAQTALERLDNVELILNNVISGVNQAFGKNENRYAELAENLAAVVELLGGEKVSEVIQANRDLKRQEAIDKAEAALQVEIASGKLVPGDTASLGDLVVCAVTDEQGNEIPGKKFYEMVDTLIPEVKDGFVGKGVGTELKIGVDSIRLLGIYRNSPAQASEPNLPEPAFAETKVESSSELSMQ